MSFCFSAADSRLPYPTPPRSPVTSGEPLAVSGFQSGGLGCQEEALDIYYKVQEKKRHHQTLSVMVSRPGIAIRVMPELALELGGEALDLVAEVPSHPGLRRARSTVPSASVPSGIQNYELPLVFLASPSHDSYAFRRDCCP